MQNRQCSIELTLPCCGRLQKTLVGTKGSTGESSMAGAHHLQGHSLRGPKAPEERPGCEWHRRTHAATARTQIPTDWLTGCNDAEGTKCKRCCPGSRRSAACDVMIFKFQNPSAKNGGAQPARSRWPAGCLSGEALLLAQSDDVSSQGV